MYSFHRIIRGVLGAVLVFELGLQIMGSRWALEQAVFNEACEMQGIPSETTFFGYPEFPDHCCNVRLMEILLGETALSSLRLK
jgi:hypothetical protein